MPWAALRQRYVHQHKLICLLSFCFTAETGIPSGGTGTGDESEISGSGKGDLATDDLSKTPFFVPTENPRYVH